MEIKDWLSDNEFRYDGKVLAKDTKDTYLYTYRNKRLEAVDAQVILWVDVSDNKCINIYHRINSGEINNHYIGFWKLFTTTPVYIDSISLLDLEALPINSSSAVIAKKAIESILPPFYAIIDSYMKDSKRYSFDAYNFPIFSVAKMSIMLTDKTPLDWFTLPDSIELKGEVADLVHCIEVVKAQDASNVCDVLENSVQLRQARAAVLKRFFRGDNMQDCIEAANTFYKSQSIYKLYIPVMRKFFKDGPFFSESYIDYPNSIV